jgi:hypothetical protein
MPTVKEQIVEDINNCAKADLNEREITRKMFLLDPAFVFKENKILGFRILNSIAEKFRIPLSCVKIAGSSQTGFSSIKNREFVFGESDLDIAVVSPNLFQRYCEIVFNTTNGYKNQTGFKDTYTLGKYLENLHFGFFRPDFMPNCKEKDDWFTYFKSISDKHSTMFKNINAGIYFSETFFEQTQITVIQKLNKG